jgi:predicted CXXCH cytochrome family protein
VNSGTSTLTADSCAGCHRAHTAQGALLLKTEQEALCLSCHGTTGTGATANVEDGVQYKVANDGSGGSVAGALRGGGFVNARIDSTNPTRVTLPRWDSTNVKFVASFSSKVSVTSGDGVTSAHLLIGTSGIEPTHTAWGNSSVPNSGVGPIIELECGSCHNPHGNGQYRILNPIPKDGDGPLVEAGTGVNVAEMRTYDTVSGTRNYTVQWGASLSDVATAAVYPSGTTASETLGDYFRRYQPYDIVPIRRTDFDQTKPTSSSTGCASNPAQNTSVTSGDSAYRNCATYFPAGYFRGDAPEFVPASFATGPTGFANATNSTLAGNWRTQITNWCATCHTKYNNQKYTAISGGTGVAGAGFGNPNGSTNSGYPSGSASYNTPSGDDIFKYRHPTSVECTQCHVAHGSNAKMTGSASLGTAYSLNFPYPDASGGTDPILSDSSRLLKVDNRGTCQQCHDPTETIPYPATPTYP